MSTHRRAVHFGTDLPTDQRQAFGCIVPWNVTSWVTDDEGATWYPEFHARGSIAITPGTTIPVYDGHDSTGNRGPHVADVVELEDRPDGLYGRVVMHRGIDRLPAGAFSIEFDAYSSITDPASGAVARTHSLLTGLAFTNSPQFSTARVESFRATNQGAHHMNMHNPQHPFPPQATGQQPQQQWPQQQPQPPQQLQAPSPQQAPQQQWPQQQWPQQPAAQPQFSNPAPVPAQSQQAPQQPEPVAAFRGSDEAARQAAAAQSVSVITSQVQRARFRGIGDFMHAVANGKIEAEYRDEVFRALAINVTTDTPGLMRENWVTEIVDFIGSFRPFITAFSQLPLPDTGMTMTYPRITQRPTVAKQAAQGNEVSSANKVLVTKTPADIETYAGGQRISLQELQRSDPSYLAILFELYGEEMATATDVAAIAAAAAVVPVGNKINMGAALTVANFKLLNASLVAGLKKLLTAKVPLDVAYVVGVDLWEMYAAAVDDQGRPLFPHINGMNPVGSIDITNKDGVAVRTVPVAVDWNMTATKGYLGYKRAFTSALNGVQTLSADAVANLSRDEVVFQQAAFLARRPDALVEYTLA